MHEFAPRGLKPRRRVIVDPVAGANLERCAAPGDWRTVIERGNTLRIGVCSQASRTSSMLALTNAPRVARCRFGR